MVYEAMEIFMLAIEQRNSKASSLRGISYPSPTHELLTSPGSEKLI